MKLCCVSVYCLVSKSSNKFNKEQDTRASLLCRWCHQWIYIGEGGTHDKKQVMWSYKNRCKAFCVRNFPGL